MKPNFSKSKVIIFDTTLRDGELTPGVTFNLQQKIQIAQLLEQSQVDVIEVGYPGAFEKDFDEIFTIARLIKESAICGLAGSNPAEIARVGEAIKSAIKGRIHIYTGVNLKNKPDGDESEVLNLIQYSIDLAKNYCSDVEWSAFDAPRSQPDFLCKAIETAIASGASTISIPDTLGLSSTEEFSHLIETVVNRVPNIDRAMISVHCHDDSGLAVANSIAALHRGARQIECSINGLGARKGNANLETVVREIAKHQDYAVDVDLCAIAQISKQVARIISHPVI